MIVLPLIRPMRWKTSCWGRTRCLSILPTALQTNYAGTDAPALCFGSRASLFPARKSKGSSIPSDLNASASSICMYLNVEDQMSAKPFGRRSVPLVKHGVAGIVISQLQFFFFPLIQVHFEDASLFMDKTCQPVLLVAPGVKRRGTKINYWKCEY